MCQCKKFPICKFEYVASANSYVAVVLCVSDIFRRLVGKSGAGMRWLMKLRQC